MSDPAPASGKVSDSSAGNARPRRKRPNPLKRHQARTLALQVLYEADVTDHSWREIADRTIETDNVVRESLAYFELLINGIDGKLNQIDEAIMAAAPQFPVHQLPPIDRNVLRIAIFELSPGSDVPVKVAINEAVELAKHYGGENSGRFVNGALSAHLATLDLSEPDSANVHPAAEK